MNFQSPDTALLLIDLQRDFLRAEGRLPISTDQLPALLETVNTLTAQARAAGRPVVHVVNVFPRGSWLNLFRRFAAIEGSDGVRRDERCPRPLGDEPVFEKSRSDAFARTELAAWLRERGVERLVLCGVFANACVRRSAEGALAAGFGVQVPRQGVAAASDGARQRGLRAITRAGGRVVDVTEFEATNLPAPRQQGVSL